MTYKSQTKANDEVSQKALETLASFYERFGQSNKDLCEVDKKFGAEFAETENLMGKATEANKLADIAITASCHTRGSNRRLASAFDEAEIDLNDGLRRIHQLPASTTSASPSLATLATRISEEPLLLLRKKHENTARLWARKT